MYNFTAENWLVLILTLCGGILNITRKLLLVLVQVS